MTPIKTALITLLSLSLLNASTIESTVKTKSDNFCKKSKNDKNFCMDYKTSYPLISTQDKALQKQLNQAINKHILPIDTKKYVLNYLKEMNGESYGIGHSDETTIKVLSVHLHTFTLQIDNYSYMGGAHGNYDSGFETYERQTGKKLSLDTLFIPKYQKKLLKIAQKTYRESNGIMPSESLVTTMGWFDNKFILPSAIGIGKDGLHFEYNPYEIRAYVYGPTSLVIPFDKLSSLIPKDSYLSSLLDSQNSPKSSQIINKTFGEEGQSQMKVKSERLSQNRLKITVSIDNLSKHRKGGLSLSFPQLKSKQAITQTHQSGFKKVSLYPKGKSIYHIGKKRVIKAQYLLAEADTNQWEKGRSNSISLTIKIPSHIETLYLGARATFSHKKEILTVPNYGIEGQQGFHNYRLAISLR